MNKLTSALTPELAAVLLAAVVCFFHIHQGTLGVDGVRYAAISREVLRGNFFSPFDAFTLMPYANKPPVMFWLIALSFKVLGYSTFAARLPSAVIAFLALLALFFSVRELFSARAALLAVIFQCGNSFFFRSLIDLNFEALILLAAVLLFSGLAALLRGKNSRRAGFVSGLGLAVLMVSKPPYVALVFPAAFWVTVVLWRELRVREIKRALLAGLIPVALSLLWVPFCFSVGYAAKAYQNQIINPLYFQQTRIENLRHWLFIFFVYLAPLSWAVLAALSCLLSSISSKTIRERFPVGLKPEEALFFAAWLAPLPVIILAVRCYARYLLLPLVGGSVLVSIYAAYFLSRLSVKTLPAIVTFSAVTIAVALVGFNARVHRVHPLVLAARHVAGEPEQIFCIDGENEADSVPARRRTEVILDLHFGLTPAVFSSVSLPVREDGPPKRVAAESRCRGRLLQRYPSVRVVYDEREFSILELPLDTSLLLPGNRTPVPVDE